MARQALARVDADEAWAARGSLRSRVSRALQIQLEHAGFRQRPDGTYAVELGAQTIGWVGLGIIRRRGLLHVRLRVRPVIGVRHLPTERLLAALLGERLHPFGPPTFSTPLRQVMPPMKELPPCASPSRGDPTQNAGHTDGPFRSSAPPLLRRHLPPPPVPDALAPPDVGFPVQNQLRLPVIQHLLGRNAQAEQYLAERVAALGRRCDPDAQYYRRFAQTLREHMAAARSRATAGSAGVVSPEHPGKRPAASPALLRDVEAERR